MRLPRRAELSEEQEDFLMDAPLDVPVICTGPPGTGKTVLALYRAALLEKMSKQTDLIMKSKLLSRYVQRSLDELGFDTESRTWHSWVYNHHGKRGRFGEGVPEESRWNPDFMKMIEWIRDGKADKPEALYWDCLIVDEGQDFPKEFYLYLTSMMTNPSVVDGRDNPGVTVFADENQRLEERHNSTIAEIKARLPGIATYEVHENYRNSAPIARLAQHFYIGLDTGKPDIPEHRNGQIPVLREFDDIEEEMQSVARWMHNNEDLSAGIIVANTRVQRRVMKTLEPLVKERGLKIQKYKSGVDADKLDFYTGGTVTVVCDKSCKGLEFDGVFIPQLQHYQSEGADEDFFKMKMYVMASRARSFLQLSYSESDEPPAILRLLPQREEKVLKWET